MGDFTKFIPSALKMAIKNFKTVHKTEALDIIN